MRAVDEELSSCELSATYMAPSEASEQVIGR
jgi:hypothetical protein